MSTAVCGAVDRASDSAYVSPGGTFGLVSDRSVFNESIRNWGVGMSRYDSFHSMSQRRPRFNVRWSLTCQSSCANRPNCLSFEVTVELKPCNGSANAAFQGMVAAPVADTS